MAFAFWKYDIYPYCLGGEVLRKTGDGGVYVKGYSSLIFSPIAILPDSQGEKIKAELERLESEYREKSSALLKEYKKKAKKVANFLKD